MEFSAQLLKTVLDSKTVGLPIAIAAVAFALVAVVVLFAVLRRRGIVKRHPELLARHQNSAGFKLVSKAEAAEKASQYELAGDLFLKVGLKVEARKNYVQAKAALKLAQSYLQDGSKVDAAQWFEKAGEFDQAKALFLEAGRSNDAARAAKQAHQFEQAADILFDAAQPAAAAELYKLVGNTAQAVTSLEQAGDSLGAARVGAAKVLDYLKSLGKGGASPPSVEKEMHALAKRVAGPLAASEDKAEIERALQLQLFVRDYGAAGELYRRLGKLEKAVEFYLRDGKKRQAADVLDELGRPKESAMLKGEDFEARRMKREAVAQYETAELWDRAAVLLEELGDRLKAAVHYRRLGNLARSGELLVLENKHAEAAEIFREAELNDEALDCYAAVGDWGTYTALLEELERYYDAGVNYAKRGLVDKAIKALQRVDEEDEKYRDASVQLGDLFQEKTMYGLAKEKYLSVVGQERIQRKNLELFYKLASAYESNGEHTLAMQTFEKILGYDFHFRDVGQRISDIKSRIAARTTGSGQLGQTPMDMTPSNVDPYAQTIVQAGQTPVERRRYEVLKELGRGGMGVVYKARDQVLDRIVALKVLPPMFRQNEAALRNFFREAKSAAALSHSNIVTVFDTGEEAGSMFIAMEYVEGRDLKEIVTEEGAFPLGPLALIFGQMCQALGYAHEKSIVHRDIKPSNVLWTKEKQCKITDFGLARALGQGANTLTTTGGTPYYMSPEQTLGNQLDHRTDLYSLGITMFELATGRLPYTDGDIGYHHVHSPVPDPRAIKPQLPPPIAEAIMRCMAKNPDERYADAAAVFEDLRKLAGS